MSSDPIVGIDLGTTNSLVAYGDEAGARVIPDAEGRALLPSVVAFEGASVLVGHAAREGAAVRPRSTFSSVKRLMGRGVGDVREDLPLLSYEVVAGERDTARVLVPGSDGRARAVSPEEISAHVLRALRERASAALGREVRRAVVTVPAYFDDAQRQATRDAGRLAGLEVVRIVNEPTAAALAYGLGLRRDGGGARTVAVYDFGGGTFDVSVLRITPGTDQEPTSFFQVLSTAGDTRLGGDDIDRALARAIAGERVLSPADGAALVRAAESARCALSESARATLSLTLSDGTRIERAVTREDVERAAGPFVERTIACCARALEDASRAAGEDVRAGLDAVVLVGGCTRTPLVRRRVGEFFGREPYTALDPERVVALGAAVQASVLAGIDRSALLFDVVPLSLGIETAGGAFAKIIMRNSTVPARASEMFSTSVDGQTSIRLRVLQGEREMSADCRDLGVFHLGGIPPMPAGIPQVEVEFLVDANGVLRVSAVERRSGKRAALQVVPSHGLTADEVARMEAESVAHAREDMERHRVTDLIVNSKLDLKWIGERLERLRPLLDAGYAADLAGLADALRGFVARAEADWRSVDANEFHRAKEALDRGSVRLQEVGIAASLRGEG